MTPTSDNPFPIPIHEPINAGTDATGKEGIKESSGPEARETPRSSSSEEIWRVLEEASPQLRPLYQLMIFTGLRKGELAHLEWGDVDFGNKVLQVQTKGEWSPKSGEGRTIPLNQPSIDALRTAWEANERRKVRSNLVFPGRKGYLSDIRAGLNAACDRARVPRIHVHGLRHTFGSIMAVMEGVNPFAIKEAMGHKDIKTTMNYVSMAKPYIREQVEKLNAIPVPKTISPKFAQNNIIERRKKKKGTRIRPNSL